MAEPTPDEQTPSPEDQIDAEALDPRQALKNALVLAVADGKLTEQEKACIESLRQRLGVDAEDFRRLCHEVKQGSRKLSVPREPNQAEQTVALLMEIAAADAVITPPEQRALRMVADYVGFDATRLETMLDDACRGEGVDDRKLEAMAEELYTQFGQWDGASRRAKVGALGDLGRCGVRPLLRILESYRKPEGAPDALELKTLVAEQLGRLGDTRPVYYLAQHVNIGDSDDEISSLALRAAAAEAIGTIIGQSFSRDQDGIDAARQWWQDEGNQKYNRLFY